MNDFLRVHHPLSLHHLTALDASPAELIGIAGALGCTHVTLFTHVPEAARHVYPMVTAEAVAELRAALDRSGVTLCNLEVFPLDSDPDWQGFERGLAVGAALGARKATAHIHDADESSSVSRFARFCDMAAAYGIEAGLEFNAFSAVKTLPAAAAIIRATGFGSLVCDMLHLFRSGGTPQDVASAAGLIGYAQLCDGPASLPDEARWHEAIRERLLPGHGAFPLREAVEALRTGTVLEIEVPQTAARKAGVPPLDRARRAVRAARHLFDRMEERA
jgi:sugar phosphate isomerase/epimerase